MFNRIQFRNTFETMLKLYFAKNMETASTREKYSALAHTLMSLISDDWGCTDALFEGKRRAYYFSAEFLIGRSLANNMLNIGYYDEIKSFVEDDLGLSLTDLEEEEEDAALGNGGLGRLAACFMESATTKNLPLMGYGVLYSQGLFKQLFVDGFQAEEGDHWIEFDTPWMLRVEADAKIIHFRDQTIRAIPYDIPILGYNTRNTNTLRLWRAEAMKNFDFNLFNAFEYDRAVEQRNRAEDISRVLYPNDVQRPGRVLRLKQQYFFVSASLQDILAHYKMRHGKDFSHFADEVVIQLNDTHPVIAIPELMRLLMDEEFLGWDDAWAITKKVFAFTNHTILAEAMETWAIDIFEEVSPRALAITREINRRFVMDLEVRGYTEKDMDPLLIIKDGRVRMAPLAIHTSIAVNGVAKLHTEILKNDTLRPWHELYPTKFQNKTNGITPRRWLMLSNPELTEFITNHLGSCDWQDDLTKLQGLMKFIDDDAVLKELMAIKHKKKEELAAYIEKHEGIKVDPDSLFDVQVKRIHEYKRQLLNAFYILDLYLSEKENPTKNFLPQTFIFGGKAAPGYFRAKGIIKFINEIAKKINVDPDMDGKLRVVFVENYRVSYGERIFPAADISEQISTAGKEASGTGNMKFMLNATPTLGTYDGANVEIVEEAGMDANFIFGARVEELMAIKDTYNPREYYMKDRSINRVVDALIDGSFSDGDSFMFFDIYQSLVDPKNGTRADEYFLLKDFDSYKKMHKAVEETYRDRRKFAQMCLKNLAFAGKFSSDRTIEDYAREIWKIDAEAVGGDCPEM